MPDEKPETETETPAETPPESPPEPPRDEEKVPAWGQSLIAKVDSLAEKLQTPAELTEEVPDGGVIKDQSPVKKPWHKRGL